MFPLLVATALSMSIERVQPPDYSEKSLCDLWAGAQCHATSCMPDAKERCTAASARCRHQGSAVVPQSRAERVATCAKAMLKGRCGDPAPAECEGVEYP